MKRLDIEEQYGRIATNAAATNANSTVQRNPKSSIGSEQRVSLQDSAASPKTPVQLTKMLCGKRLDMDEQPNKRRVVTNAATTNANFIVQRIPKSNPGGEQQAEQREMDVSQKNIRPIHQQVAWTMDGHRGAVPILAEIY